MVLDCLVRIIIRHVWFRGKFFKGIRHFLLELSYAFTRVWEEQQSIIVLGSTNPAS